MIPTNKLRYVVQQCEIGVGSAGHSEIIVAPTSTLEQWWEPDRGDSDLQQGEWRPIQTEYVYRKMK